LEEFELTVSRQVKTKDAELPANSEMNAIRQALGDVSQSLSSILDVCTLGIAIYDENSRCVVMNKAITTLNGSPARTHIGKTIRQSLGNDASQVEPAFRHVWTTGKPLHDVELTVCPPGSSEVTHFNLNLYPFRDNPGQMRLIGVLFYEITNRKRLQERLRILIDKSGKPAPDEDKLFAGESLELSAQSVEMLHQSIELLEFSMALRCQISEMRIVAALRRAAPFSDVPQDTQALLNLVALSQKPGSDLSEGPVLQKKGGETADSPSHREQQVMQLLVEGCSNKEIATSLDLSIRTVEVYRARLMVKLHLHSVAELVRYAVRNNLIKA
jgi:DNA-binding CsgD family transcriptional regulator